MLQPVIKAIQKGGGNYVLQVKDKQKILWATINEEIEKIKKKTWDKLDCTETLWKEHGQIDRVVFRMLSDTGLVYEKHGVKSFYETIAWIGIMDKTTDIMKDGE